MATIGDVNGDGLDDFAIGAPYSSNNNRPKSGSVYVVYGGASGTLDVTNIGSRGYRIDGATAFDVAGRSVAAAGDVNGDAVDDILIGAPGLLDTGVPGLPTVRNLRGRVFVVFGAARSGAVDLNALGANGFVINGPIGNPTTTASTPAFGEALSSAPVSVRGETPDVNGDGLADIAIGDANSAAAAAGTNSSKVWVIFGKADATAVNVGTIETGVGGYTITGQQAEDLFGFSVAIVGDLTGDELADVAVGAPGDQTNPNGGQAWLIPGHANTQNDNLAVALPARGFVVAGASGEQLGLSVAALGDANADGMPDVAFAGQNHIQEIDGFDNSETFRSFQQGTTTLNTQGNLLSVPGTAELAGTADLNGDDQFDLIVGRPSRAGQPAANTIMTRPARRARFGAGGIDALGVDEALTLSGASGSQTGASVDTYETGSTGEAGVIVGSPTASNNGRSESGSAYLVTAPKAAPVAHGVSGEGCKTTIRMRTAVDIPSCRFTSKGAGPIKDQTLNASGCGLAGPGCPVRASGKTSRARYTWSKRFNVPNGTSPDAALIGGDYAWRLMDSLNNTIGYVRRTKKKDYEGAAVKNAREGKKPRALTFFDADGVMIGRSGADEPRQDPDCDPATPSGRVSGRRDCFLNNPDPKKNPTRVESAPCITARGGTQRDRSRETALVYFAINGGSADDDTANLPDHGGRPISVRAIINRAAFAEHSFGVRTNNELLDPYWVPCSRNRFLRRNRAMPSSATRSYSAPHFSLYMPASRPPAGDAYQGFDTASGDCKKGPNCGGPLRNYEFPELDLAGSNIPHYPDTVMLLNSTTGVRGAKKGRYPGAGIARGVLRVGSQTSVNVIDSTGYLDANVPCAYTPVAHWQLVRLQPGIFGWVPRRHGDGLQPALPADTVRERRIGETFGCDSSY